MRRLILTAAAAVLATGALAPAAIAGTPPTVTSSFDPSSIAIGQGALLTVTLSGGDGSYTSVGFRAGLSTGLTTTAASSAQCGGTLTANPAVTGSQGVQGAEITLTGATLAAGGTCTVTVPVTAQGAGQQGASTTETATGSPTGPQGDVASSSATLTVTGSAQPATVTSAFTPSTFAGGTTTSYAIDITNPNPATTLHNLRWDITDLGDAAYPGAFTVNTCGGTADDKYPPYDFGMLFLPFESYSGGTLAPGASCEVAVEVTAGVAGQNFASQSTVTVMSDEGGASQPSIAKFDAIGTTSQQTTTPPPPSNAFTHAAPRLTADGTITDKIAVPGKGTLVIRETWKGKLIARVTKRTTAKGTLSVRLVPNAATRRRLKHNRHATLKLTEAFTPTGGTARSRTITAHTPR